MPGAFLPIRVFECFPDVGGSCWWVGEQYWLDGNGDVLRWWQGWHNRQPKDRWWCSHPNQWREIGWELWRDDRDLVEAIYCFPNPGVATARTYKEVIRLGKGGFNTYHAVDDSWEWMPLDEGKSKGKGQQPKGKGKGQQPKGKQGQLPQGKGKGMQPKGSMGKEGADLGKGKIQTGKAGDGKRTRK